MKASAVASALGLLVSTRQPVFVWGSPGVGKSDVVRQVAESKQVALQDVRALLLDPVDLRGLPFLSPDKQAKWATPDFLPREGEGILFLDELNSATAMVQASCYQLVLDRKLGEYTLPDGWAIVAAGNRESDRGVTTRMPTPLRNRFTHLQFEVDMQEWCEWLIAGTVGDGTATEFSAFLATYRNLPNIDAILLHPDQEPVPNNAAAQFAVSTALSHCATDTNFDRVCRYLQRMPTEFGVLCVRDASLRQPAVRHTPAYTKWAVANHHVLA